MAITRKQFLGAFGGGTVLLVLQSCGGGGSSYGGSTMTTSGGCSDTIAQNHGHVLMIALADLDSTVDKSYDIRGSADHTHTVTFTVAQLQALKTGQPVTVSSTTSASALYGTHFHSVSASCVM